MCCSLRGRGLPVEVCVCAVLIVRCFCCSLCAVRCSWFVVCLSCVVCVVFVDRCVFVGCCMFFVSVLPVCF